ncbi:hypothetical protein COU76_01605 [Candidatus Peregrinibacteria bacterium CG10_big_fil_rev_8_21_14_0_10_49_10]|nr:MAG: hypothetical protein COU76_01605 [Candidatus Peregrinibacteria bacterium CG10_big_fil_rev_8_21_14_0_10_49_10]
MGMICEGNQERHMNATTHLISTTPSVPMGRGLIKDHTVMRMQVLHALLLTVSLMGVYVMVLEAVIVSMHVRGSTLTVPTPQVYKQEKSVEMKSHAVVQEFQAQRYYFVILLPILHVVAKGYV